MVADENGGSSGDGCGGDDDYKGDGNDYSDKQILKLNALPQRTAMFKVIATGCTDFIALILDLKQIRI